MNYFLLAAGIALLAFTVLDIGKTAISPHGAGWFSGRLSRGIWLLARWASGYNPRRRGLAYAGSFIIGAILLAYILMLWVGNTLIFLSDDGSVIHGSTKRHANVWEVAYFVGYNLSTMGNGDFVGGTPFWKLFATFISFTGLVLITITITYLVPVVEAQVGKQQLSLRIHGLGESPYALLKNCWNGQDFKSLDNHLTDLADAILYQGQLHMAYPVLRYFHAPDAHHSDSVSLSVLDEALSILTVFVPAEQRPEATSLRATRQALDAYLETLRSAFIQPEAAPPPLPDLAPLKRQGMTIVDNDLTRARFRKLDGRREMLCAMLQNEAWRWKDVYQVSEEKRTSVEATEA